MRIYTAKRPLKVWKQCRHVQLLKNNGTKLRLERNVGKRHLSRLAQPRKSLFITCVINGYGNATLEVCAPERLILGNILHYCKIIRFHDQLF